MRSAAERAPKAYRVPLVFSALTIALAPIAYMCLFSVFQTYDDEGYFLITLHDYLAGHPLFTQALPIYGPFYYEVMGGVFKALGVEPSLDAGRFMTLVVLLVASLLGGVLAHRLTRNVWLGISGQLLTFRVLTGLANEPMHPQGLASVLLLSLMIAATFRSSRPRVTGAVIGAIVGALLMVKLNLGIFAGAAVVFAWAGSQPDRWRRFTLPLTTALLVALPLVLMSSLLRYEWVLELAIVVALSAAALGVVAQWTRPEPSHLPSVKSLAIGGAVVVLGSLGVAVAGGTRLEEWWSRSVVLAINFPQLFMGPALVNAEVAVWAGISVAAALAFCGRYARAGAPPAVGLLRIWTGFFIWLSMIVRPFFLLALPLAWMAGQAPRDDVDSPTGPYARLLLPALAVMESLQLYPLASGTQLSVAALGLLPLGAISLNDGIFQLRLGGRASTGLVRLANGLAPATLLASVAAFLPFTVLIATQFASLTPLDLPGAELLKLPAEKGVELRALVAAIDHDCGSFITFPGMNSFYFWTRQDPPADVSSEAWWLVLDSGEQQALVDQLEVQPRLCVVKNQRVIDFWAQGRPVPSRPLVVYIDANFVHAGSYGDYELLVPRLSSYASGAG